VIPLLLIATFAAPCQVEPPLPDCFVVSPAAVGPEQDGYRPSPVRNPPAPQPLLLDFYTDDCVPCRKMEPTIQALEKAGYQVERIDAKARPDLVSQFRIKYVPTLVLLLDGEEAQRRVGSISFAELEALFTEVQDGREADSE
jgi:thioredoxin 1